MSRGNANIFCSTEHKGAGGMWDWSRPEPEHTPHRGRATRAHTCTRARICARTDARTEAHLHLQPDQQRDRADMRAHTHIHAHAPRRLTGVPRALRPLHIRRRSWDDTAEFICVGGRTPLRAQSPILRGSWRVPDPLVRSCDSLDRPAPENPHCCRLSWSTFLVSQCSSCHHRGNETAR